MSFIKKAVKKIFKVVKKIVKSKIFKIVAIAALSFFTAGIASGLGFSAFSGVSTIGGFFGAVGSTISAGFTATVGSLFGAAGGGGAGGAAAGAVGADGMIVGTAGIGVGAAPGAAAGTVLSAGSQAAANAGMIMGGAGAAGTASMAPSLGAALVQTGGKEAAKPLLSRIFGSIMAPTTTGSMMRTGLMMGAQAWMQNDALKDAKAYRDSKNIWGTSAFGGDGVGWDLFSPIARDPNASYAQQSAMEGAAQGGPTSADALLTPDQFQQSTDQRGGGAPPLPEGQNVQRAGLLAANEPATQQAPPPGGKGGKPAYDPYGGVRV